MKRATVFLNLLLILGPLALAGLVALAIGMPWASSTGSASPGGSLACSVKASCDGGEVEVLRMSSVANAHAGTPGGSSYGERVCCGDVQGLGNNCSGVYDTVLTLWAADNAHVASDGSYGTEVCLSGNGDDATADIAYAVGDCPAEYACLATISGSTNAHVADCDGVDDYATKVCGLVTGDNCPTTPNPGQENADGDQWGDACENCPSVPTPWFVQPGDSDCDGFTDAEEGNVGTDAADWCPDDPSDDTWPSDYNMDGACNILDIVQWTPPYFNVSPPDPYYDTRKDFNGDNAVNILDIVRMTPPMFNTTCVP